MWHRPCGSGLTAGGLGVDSCNQLPNLYSFVHASSKQEDLPGTGLLTVKIQQAASQV